MGKSCVSCLAIAGFVSQPFGVIQSESQAEYQETVNVVDVRYSLERYILSTCKVDTIVCLFLSQGLYILR